jgi:YHS domain-containing protein
MIDCAFCGCRVEAHDRVRATRDGNEYAFCNWACLTPYVDQEELATGARCTWALA